jgi:hypothetical protein
VVVEEIIISRVEVPAYLIHLVMGNTLLPDIIRVLFSRKEY